MAMNSFISKCGCQHPGQDNLHGQGNRVFNMGLKNGKCSVCGASKDKPKEA